MSITITSEAFQPNGPIPQLYSGDGDDTSPMLAWTGIPEDATELALIMDDPDAPMDEPFVHWVIWKLPANLLGLPAAVPTDSQPAEPAGARQGQNSFGNVGYGGPAPPPGHGTHHYHFRLYALDAPLGGGEEHDKESLLAAISGHILAEGELIGTYERPGT